MSDAPSHTGGSHQFASIRDSGLAAAYFFRPQYTHSRPKNALGLEKRILVSPRIPPKKFFPHRGHLPPT